MAQQNDNLTEIVHVVGAGENLSVIAADYGVTVDEIVATNDLDLDAILQIGQRIIIEFSAGAEGQLGATAEAADNSPAGAPEESIAVDAPRAVGGVALDNDLPPAPVAAADAPMMHPADSDPVVCVSVYVDDNLNGAMDPGETTLSEGRIELLDEAGKQLADLRIRAESQPLCVEDLQPQVFFVAAAASEGYGLTGSQALRVDLRDGQPIHLAFGVKTGLNDEEPPEVQSSATDVPPASITEGENLMRELSGLFIIALAGFVLISGLSVSLFLRFR